jgi:hypothetical protein
VDDTNYAGLVDKLAELLSRQMRTKEYRHLCLRCLAQLLTSYIIRYR